MLHCNNEQERVIVDNFEGKKLEVNSVHDLKEILGETSQGWKDVLDLMDDAQMEEPWFSQSVVLGQDPVVEEMAKSVLEGTYVHGQHEDLYSSWIQLLPSAPNEDEF